MSPRELNHFGQRRSATITANLAPDYDLGQAIFMNETAAQVLPPGYTTELNGHFARIQSSSQGALGVVFVLALVFIFFAGGAVRALLIRW